MRADQLAPGGSLLARPALLSPPALLARPAHLSPPALLAVALLALPTSASAAGFAVGEQGAASGGLAGAATARLDLPDAGYYNPAALPRGNGLLLSAGVSLVAPSLSATDPAGGGATQALPGFVTPPAFELAFAAADLSVGLHVGVPYGAALGWPEDWPGRFDVTSIALQVFEVAPSVGWRPVESFSIAAGPRILRGTVELARQVDAVSSEGSVALGGAATGLGAQVAAAYGPVGPVTFGLTYRSRAHLAFDGSAHFEDVPPELSGKAHDGKVTTEVTLPDRLAAGAALELGYGTASLDVEYTAWSTFETFAIDFADEATPDVSQPRRWRDTVAVRGGYEQRLAKALVLRGGLAWDPTPSPTDTLSPTLPDSDRVLLTAGGGYAIGQTGLTADLAVGHVFLLGASSTGDEAFPAKYAGRAELFALGLSYRR